MFNCTYYDFYSLDPFAGYGFIDEVSALYGLIWNKPKFIYVFALKALQQPTEEPFNFYMFRKVLFIKTRQIF